MPLQLSFLDQIQAVSMYQVGAFIKAKSRYERSGIFKLFMACLSNVSAQFLYLHHQCEVFAPAELFSFGFGPSCYWKCSESLIVANY